MEALQGLVSLLKEPLVQFFIWVAVLFLIASVFLERRVSFWVSSIGATYFWLKSQDPTVALKAWLVILVLLGAFLLTKYTFNLNPALFLRGRKRCPMCWEEVHRKAKVCPHCHHEFAKLN